MATQKDLDVLKQKLRDLDVKLKSMGGGSSQRDPRFDSAMANQNYANLMRDQQARLAAERGTPKRPEFRLQIPRPPQSRPSPELGTQSVDPRAPQDRFDKSKRRSGKEILLSFAGGQYGSINDEAANAIAKKYNLEIFSKPNLNRDEGPKVYGFSVKGNVDKNLSGIRNEPGIRNVSANSRGFIPEQGPDPFITYEDNRMRAALNGEELPTPPVGYVEGFDRSKKKQIPLEIGGMGGQRPPQGPQVGGGMGGLAPQQPNQIPQPRIRIPQGPQVGGGPDFVDNREPGMNYTMNMIDYIDPATGEKASRTNGVVPGPGSRFVPAYQANLYRELLKAQGPQVGGDFTQGRYGIPEGPQTPQGAMASQYSNQQPPQASQGAQSAMATYNNLLQQGIQRSNTMNQDAASNFANMQAGAPIPQPATPAKANPTMPIAGLGMQQPRATPAPRKFSTVNTPSARFG